ncbi:AMIN domain-containing protein [Desulfovibrio aminophilus]|uniref:AMIN domain-containing protein n=1 Tax=Desulfovibrio aminophilus TaxID=81425 RepID=UPI00339A29EC
MPVLFRRASRLIAVLLLALACAVPARAEEEKVYEVRMPVDLTVVPLDGVEPPLVAEPAPTPAVPPAPAVAPASADKAETKKAEKKAEAKAAPRTPAKEAAQAAPAEKKPAPVAAQEKKPAASAAEAAKPKAEAEKKAAAPAGTGIVRDIQMAVRDGVFVLRVVTDRPVGVVTHLNFKNPRRLAVDIMGNWRRPGKAAISAADGPVKTVRVGEHPDRLRLVLDFRDGALGADAVPEIAKTPDGLTVAFPVKP